MFGTDSNKCHIIMNFIIFIVKMKTVMQKKIIPTNPESYIKLNLC